VDRIGFLFPGQGAQYVGMGKKFYESSEIARNIFRIASDVLGFDVAKMCFEGTKQELSATKNSQPAILTVSIAALKSYPEIISKSPQCVAGLSLGEYSALVAAEALRFEDAVCLVRKRGEFMQQAALQNPGGMLCLLGADINTAKQLCDKTGMEIANLNSPGQVVISGSEDSIRIAMDEAVNFNIKKVIRLDTSGPFHCSKMKAAAEKLKMLITDIKMQKPKCRFICNTYARFLDNPEDIKNALIRQVEHPVLWEMSMTEMKREGFLNFLEMPPGRVLQNLSKHISQDFNVTSIDQ
jgi:[acyl-carrier-protein] S-malonyltransferase